MKTIVISIGNSDNKLTQVLWSEFVDDVDTAIRTSGKIHFFGGAANWMPWQNVAWLFDCDEGEIELLKRYLTQLRKRFNQDSIAYIEGNTEFL